MGIFGIWKRDSGFGTLNSIAILFDFIWFFQTTGVIEIGQWNFELIGFLKMLRKSTLLKQKPFVFRHWEGQQSGIYGFWECDCRNMQACVSPRHSIIGTCGAWMENNSKVWNGLADTRGTASFLNLAFLTLDDTICLHIYFGSYCLFSSIESGISKCVG